MPKIVVDVTGGDPDLVRILKKWIRDARGGEYTDDN